MSRIRRNPPEPAAATELDEFDKPSKSARKRAALAGQALGVRLIALKETDLVRLPLPQTVLEAVRAAQRIKARGGLARQKQYIGKLMRDVDTLAIEAALAQLR
jgi:ribosome-associated protein